MCVSLTHTHTHTHTPHTHTEAGRQAGRPAGSGGIPGGLHSRKLQLVAERRSRINSVALLGGWPLRPAWVPARRSLFMGCVEK